MRTASRTDSTPATAAEKRQPNSGAVVTMCPAARTSPSTSWYPNAHSPIATSHLPSGGCTTYPATSSL